MKRVLFAVIALLLIGGAADAQVDFKAFSAPVEGRAIWLDASTLPTNDADMAAYVVRLKQANFNILMPETVRRGYTIYPSKIDEQDPRFVGYDPLASLIKYAHQNRMQVHAWVTTFRVGYTNNKGPILKAHPDWVALNKFGEALSPTGGYWLCPSIPEAREYMASLYREIAKDYDVDGLHFDYIRFENQNPVPYCYNDSCREKFKAAYGIDPVDIDPFSPQQIEWHAWRERLINTFVQKVSQEVKAIKPGITLSAAVSSDPENARITYLQNWGNWVDNKWIDFVCPMIYTANTDTFIEMVKKETKRIDGKAFLLPGLGLLSYPEEPERAVEQVAAARELGASGATLFAAVYLKDPFVTALCSGPFSGSAAVPFCNPDSTATYLLRESESCRQVNTPQSLGQASVLAKDAATTLRYLQYRRTDTGYIPPTKPPLNIPAKVVPLPTIQVPKVTTPPVIDGNLDDPAWQQAAEVSLDYTADGISAPADTHVKAVYDDTNIYFAFTAREPRMDTVKAVVTKRDGPTFYDDSIELFLDPEGKRRSYYHLSVNTLGTQFDQKVFNPGWNGTWTAATSKGTDEWTVEIAVPFSDFKLTAAPNPGEKWTANFARTRVLDLKEPQYMLWSPTYGSFHRPERFGVLKFT